MKTFKDLLSETVKLPGGFKIGQKVILDLNRRIPATILGPAPSKDSIRVKITKPRKGEPGEANVFVSWIEAV